MGLEELVRALARPEVQATAALAIVGGGSAEGRLRQLVAELGLGSRVRFAGRVGDDELPDWYRAGDLFVLPTVAYEGFGMVTAEALASGTPVVGTPVGATPELLEGLEPSLLAEHADAGSLAAAISRGLALAGPGLAERARAYAVERFGWDAVVARWEAALELAAAGRRRAEAATVR
jgi:glycosyltransferase involved in cell wall biosynthesis